MATSPDTGRGRRSASALTAALDGPARPGTDLAFVSPELSGGMRQRVLIALSLLLSAIADPRRADDCLDILTQRNIMDVLKELRAKLGFSMLFISHDLALAAELADRVVTVYAGKSLKWGRCAPFPTSVPPLYHRAD